MKKNKHRYSLMERIAIIVCSFVSVVAIAILLWVQDMTQQLRIDDNVFINENQQQAAVFPENITITETTIPENTEGTTTPEVTKEATVAETTEETTVEETSVEEPINEEVYEIQDNLSEWFLKNDSTETITLWKKSDAKGHLLIAIKNEVGEILCVFMYEDLVTEFQEWTLCDYYLEETSNRDIIDLTFTSYHEVSGNNPENVQAQVSVILNRTLYCEYYPDTIRGVITEDGQYACASYVKHRTLKSDYFLEEIDLEKCFRQVLLVLAGDSIEEVPENVVFAASGPQGSGIWKIIDGTYYCYL